MFKLVTAKSKFDIFMPTENITIHSILFDATVQPISILVASTIWATTPRALLGINNHIEAVRLSMPHTDRSVLYHAHTFCMHVGHRSTYQGYGIG